MDDAPKETPSPRSGTRVSRTFEITTRRPVAIIMVVLAVAVFGYISYQKLSLTLMPNISYPTLTVRTDYPDTAPEEVENLISRPIEQTLGVLNNLVSITSISRAGLSDVILEFGWDANMNDAVQTVRENLDRWRRPRGVNKPLILRYDPTQDPIMRIGVYGDADLFTLRRVAEEEIKQELEALKGVAAARGARWAGRGDPGGDQRAPACADGPGDCRHQQEAAGGEREPGGGEPDGWAYAVPGAHAE